MQTATIPIPSAIHHVRTSGGSEVRRFAADTSHAQVEDSPQPTMTPAAMPENTRKTRLGSLIAGFGALISIWPATQPPRYPHRSEAEALFGDGVRIGNDMRRVIEREQKRAKNSAE